MAMSFNFLLLSKFSLFQSNHLFRPLAFQADLSQNIKHHKYIGKFLNPDVQINSYEKKIRIFKEA